MRYDLSMKKPLIKTDNPTQEYLWLCNNPEKEAKYLGEWIAVIKNKIVAHGKDLKQVRIKAYQIGDHPHFSFVDEDELAVYL